MKPHIEGLYRFAYRLTGSANDAEELLQSLLSRMFLRFEKMQEIENLKSWLFRSLYNLYIDTYRKHKREDQLFVTSENDDIGQHETTPESVTELSLEQKQLMKHIDTLNDDQRSVLLLHDAEGYTLVELEDILQTPIGTLKSRLHRARIQLKESLSTEPFTEHVRYRGVEKR